ncbi:hypothetical protein WJ07_07570 [Burkholderia vietnamiensis]|nr:hypothetical protein WJ07_07570 [Burkholderia vietnamiensis]KVG07624.1 hypothetical protein WJ24_20665 [Burkholderia vietnamiensis]
MRLWRRNDRWRARFYNAVTAHPFGQGRQRCARVCPSVRWLHLRARRIAVCDAVDTAAVVIDMIRIERADAPPPL